MAATVGFAAGLGACVLGINGCQAGPERTKQAAPLSTPLPRIERKALESQEIGWLTVHLEGAPPESLLSVKPENLPAHIHSIYRLRPDRRFLYAVAELRRLNSRGPRRGKMNIRFEESRWRLSLDGSPIGDLPEFPSFADARVLLLSQPPAPRSARESPPVAALGVEQRAALASGLPADLFPALALLNAGWARSPGDPALTEAGLDGLLWLSLQTYDELELTDPILGEALALFAIAESGHPGHFVRQECLLASLLGYENHASLVAKGLPADDPVRLFADWNLQGLKVLAHRPDAEPRTEYLFLLRLAQNHTKESPWFREFEASSWGRRIDSPGLRLVLTLDPFRLGTGPAELMESQMLERLQPSPAVAGGSAAIHGEELWREAAIHRLATVRRDGQSQPESRISALEEAVKKDASRMNGGLLDQEVVRAFYFANFYSSIYSAARYYFDGQGSTDDAEALGKSIVNPPPGTAAELKDWILHRVDVRRSAKGVKAVAGDLSRLRHIGVAPLSRISYSVAFSVPNDLDPNRRAPVRGYFDGLDSRSSNLHAAARTASELLDDLAIVEQCMRLAIQRDPREVSDDLPWGLRLLGDRSGLRALVQDPTSPTTIRATALEQLAALEKTEPRILVEQYRSLIREDPDESGPVRQALVVLEKQGQVEPALRLVDEWLSRHPEHDLGWAGVVSSKSRLLRKKGKFREAWPIAQIAARTGKAECLEEAVRSLIDLGRVDEALEAAREAADHYRSDGEIALLAQVLWIKGLDDEAAQILTGAGNPMTANAWTSQVPSAFSNAFPKNDDPRAGAAFAKLNVPGIPFSNLIWFVEYLTANGRADLAVKLSERMGTRGPSGWTTVASYHALKKARSAEVARDWLRKNATPADLDIFAKQALQDEDYELVWDLPDHPDPTKNEILNLIRAACLLHQPQEERRKQLLAFFQGRPKSEFVGYGRFLLGDSDRPTLFGGIKDLGSLSSIGWVLGLTSAHEGRFDEANAWLQVCMEAGATIPPRDWAYGILRRWKLEGGGMTEVARKGTY